MRAYVPEEMSLGKMTAELRTAVCAVAGRYVGANPAIGYTCRTFHTRGFLQDAEGFYLLHLSEKLPEQEDGAYGFAVGEIWCDDKMDTQGTIHSQTDCSVWLNQKQLFCNTGSGVFPLHCKKGRNRLVIELRRRQGKMNCKIQIGNLMNVFFPGRSGQMGFAYGAGRYAEHKAKDLLPKTYAAQNLDEIFPKAKTGDLCCMVSSWVQEEKQKKVCLEIQTESSVCVRMDDRVVYEGKQGGRVAFSASPGRHILTVHCIRGQGQWYCRMHCSSHQLRLPFPVIGVSAPWLYVGSFKENTFFSAQELSDPSHVFCDQDGNKVFFRPALRDVTVRACYENAFFSSNWGSKGRTAFGRWDYALGVTLFGLLQAAQYLKSKDLREYVKGHIDQCCRFADYAQYDRSQFGFCNIVFRFTGMCMLDHCGSFGACVLAAAGKEYSSITEKIAEFIFERADKLPDGSFYRKCIGEYLENTLWADDLYMGVSFLVQYYTVTKNPKALDLACTQFLRYKHYIFSEESRLLSHVFDFKVNQPCGVSWGRGNGWGLFALAQLLPLVPKKDPRRKELLTLFLEHSAGILAQQGKTGMWHQVLTNHASFEEASCTAMFVYGFSQGIKHGWYKEDMPYRRAVGRAKNALLHRCVDRQGNVYGVCHGSMYSFDEKYYMHQLKTVVNDNHGVGIVLLALIASDGIGE